METGPLVFPPHQSRVTQGWLQMDTTGKERLTGRRQGEGDNHRKLLLLCVSVWVSSRSAVVLLWDFPGGFDQNFEGQNVHLVEGVSLP